MGFFGRITYLDQIGRPKDAFTLQDTSPAIDIAFDMGLMGEHDFFGNPIPFRGVYDIGAHEWTPEKSGSSFPQELAASLGSLYPLVVESGPLLVGLVDSQDKGSHSQVVFLRSIARQFAESGLGIILVDVSGLSNEELVNLSHSCHLGDIPLLGNSLDIAVPTTLLFDDGSLHSRWDGLALHFNLAMTLQKTFQQ